MNAAIRAITRAAIYHGLKVKAIYRGYKGLITGEIKEFKTEDVSNIIQRGGTILKTSRCEEFKTFEGRSLAYDTMVREGIDALVVVGGDGSITGAYNLAKDFDIPVLCYGLRTDFRTRAFTGSQRLFEIADRLIELETFCECGKKAVLTAKFNNGKLVLSGNQIDIGGDEKYKAMCYRCWRNFKLNRECEDE